MKIIKIIYLGIYRLIIVTFRDQITLALKHGNGRLLIPEMNRVEQAMSNPFQVGRQAKLDGKAATDNPFITGYTKLGSPKLSDEGIEWEAGYNSIGRVASKAEMNEAAKVDVSRFRRRSNNYYK